MFQMQNRVRKDGGGTLCRRREIDDEALLWTLEGVSVITKMFWIDSSTSASTPALRNVYVMENC